MSDRELFELAARLVADFAEGVDDLPVTPDVGAREIRERLAGYDFAAPREGAAVIADVAEMLRRWTVHVTHPRYFGLFNPSVIPSSVAAETLAAAVNPQLAVWSHAPAANEIERHVLQTLAGLVGYDPDACAAHFTTGGQESNLTAVAVALTHRFPQVRDDGVRALPGHPTVYVSAEGHHSFVKAAQVAGLGRGAVRFVPVRDDLKIDVAALADRIDADRAAGAVPLLVVGTAGTTGAGVVDPLPQLAELCAAKSLWFHVDAAWGGGALMSPRWRHVLAGIERADSVAWDAHKWMSIPFAAGVFLTRHCGAPSDAFDVASAYMPPPREGCVDFHRASLQWTRRATGLKVFAALAELGLPGYAEMVDRQVALGDALRAKLAAAGWSVVNDTPLPVVCFTHPQIRAGRATARRVVQRVLASGAAWISPVSLAGGPPVLRACVTSWRTTESDLDALVAALGAALSG